MAERVVLVCDVCGEPAAESASIKVGGRSLRKDLCEKHLAELTAGAQPARPGRRKAVAGKSATRRRKATARKKPTGRRKSTTRRRKSTGRRQAPSGGASAAES